VRLPRERLRRAAVVPHDFQSGGGVLPPTRQCRRAAPAGRSRNCARRGGYDWQPVRDGFGKGHPISLETRGEHKYVGRQIQFNDALRRQGSEYRHSVAKAVAFDVGIKPSGSSKVACSVSSNCQTPRQVGQLARAATSKSYPLTGTTEPTETSRTTPSLLPRAGGTGSLPGRTTLMRCNGTS